MEKYCNKCETTKPTSDFYADPQHSSGFRPHCRSCDNARSKAYRDRNKERMTQLKRNLKHANPIKYLLIHAKSRCKHLGDRIPFTLTPDDVTYVTHCPILGVELDYCSTKSKRGQVADNVASLDRIIPELGYVPGNVNIISWRANKLKSNITLDEMQAFVNYYSSLLSERAQPQADLDHSEKCGKQL